MFIDTKTARTAVSLVTLRAGAKNVLMLGTGLMILIVKWQIVI